MGRKLALAAAIVAVAAAVAAPAARLVVRTAHGYVAKVACSALYVGGRSEASVRADELHGIFELFRWEADPEARTVTASLPVLGALRVVARHRPGGGLGCVLEHPEGDAARSAAADRESRASPALAAAALLEGDPRPWPAGDATDDAALAAARRRVDTARLDAVLDAAFAEEPGATAGERKNTRAVVVLVDGQIVAERYGPGFDAATRQTGWSMTKSVGSALVGVRAHEGAMARDAPLLPPSRWGGADGADGADDRRAALTVDQALRMSTGLEFDERYTTVPRDPSVMLFTRPSTARYAAAKPLEHEPDARWSYSSGTSNLLSAALRESFGDGGGGGGDAYLGLPRRGLFGPAGMRSALVETDASGDFVLSSFCWATPRDWARFGLLYANDGVAPGGRRVLPEGWVDYTRTAAAASGRRYGAHWWLPAQFLDGDRVSALPADTFMASGFEQQVLAVSPSERVVVLRLGCTRQRPRFLIGQFLADVFATVAPAGAADAPAEA